MKSTLHAKFLEECLTNELVPNGLGLKLKVSVGNNPEDLELQASVDRILERTSLHIVDIVKGSLEEGQKSRAGHRRRKR